ncbi:hypothetical protein [Flavobacterium sp. 14A]|uniref:hypothetical protein n=1 Tax=Flavobacterium sp. 14A TaxID=2735896 RepID=UPI00156FD021|nr:hypothetical protein [Flavobacterium sp. 14A]NRT12474.1 hypothetical protein [Flavobacterium sp. 14A]
MSEYENKIFKTLTSSEDRFKSAFEIANHLNMVKRKMIQQFWKSVEKDLNELILKTGENFKVALDSDLSHPTSKCYLYDGKNPSVRVLFENLSQKQTFGIWFSDDKINYEKITEYRNAVNLDFGSYSFNHWWFAKTHVQNDFNSFESLLMILPAKMSEYSMSKAQKLFDFAVTNKVHTEYIINNCLK